MGKLGQIPIIFILLIRSQRVDSEMPSKVTCIRGDLEFLLFFCKVSL